MADRGLKVFLVAGEPSGDRLGGALMAGLRELAPGVQFSGVGGPEMAAAGLASLFPMQELSVMGIAEIAPKYFHLRRRIRETAEAVLEMRPDVLVTIDSPDFCLRVAQIVKLRSAIRTVHYVAPTVWAWRPGRAEKMAKVVDQVLALFPFEPPLMQAAGMACDFVGHTVVAEPVASAGEAAALRADLGGGPLLLALPGSRRGEVARLSGRFGAALGLVAAARPGARVVVPAAAAVVAEVRRAVADWPVPVTLIDPADDRGGWRKRAAFRAADVALAASGTVSLELAACGTPMVIGYDMNLVTRAIMARMMLIDTVTLVNIVSGTRVVPEFLGSACRPEPMAQALLQVLDAPGAQREAMGVTMERLGLGGEAPGLRAARAVLARIGQGRPDQIQPPPSTRLPSGS
jgi:lipid-A-disaccharide synthase